MHHMWCSNKQTLVGSRHNTRVLDIRSQPIKPLLTHARPAKPRNTTHLRWHTCAPCMLRALLKRARLARQAPLMLPQQCRTHSSPEHSSRYSEGNQGTARLTDIARNCVWPMLRSRLVVPPALPALAAAAATLRADAVADMAVAAEARLDARCSRSVPGTDTYRTGSRGLGFSCRPEQGCVYGQELLTPSIALPW